MAIFIAYFTKVGKPLWIQNCQKNEYLMKNRGVMETQWIATNAYVASTIQIAHKDRLELRGTFTNMEPSHLSSTPRIETSYGIRGYETDLIKYITTWEHSNREETEKHQYFLGIAVCDECSE